MVLDELNKTYIYGVAGLGVATIVLELRQLMLTVVLKVGRRANHAREQS
jgi:hypothetical protein